MKSYFLILIPAFCLMMHAPLKAQKTGKKYKSDGAIQLDDSLTTYSQSDIFLFPNVNKTLYYSDRAKLDRIRKLIPAGDDQQAYTELRAYVKNFGPDNFSIDSQLLWDLAKLSRRYGTQGEAVLLYKLILKHFQKTSDQSRSRKVYDSLTKDQVDLYVPLKEYY